jgi:hypothetical protein
MSLASISRALKIKNERLAHEVIFNLLQQTKDCKEHFRFITKDVSVRPPQNRSCEGCSPKERRISCKYCTLAKSQCIYPVCLHVRSRNRGIAFPLEFISECRESLTSRVPYHWVQYIPADMLSILERTSSFTLCPVYYVGLQRCMDMYRMRLLMSTSLRKSSSC